MTTEGLLAVVSPSVSGPGLKLSDAPVEIAAHVRRAFSLYRMYGHEHELVRQVERELHVALSGYLEQEHQLTYRLEPTALVHGERRVIEDERRDESIVRALFMDGIESITFHREIELPELTAYLHQWHLAVTSGLGAEHTFSTVIWEADYSGVSTGYRSGLAEHGVSEADAKRTESRASALLESILSASPPGPGLERVSVDSHALASLAQVDALKSVSPEDLARTASAERAALGELSKADRSALAAGLGASRRGVGQRLLVALWGAMPSATPGQKGAVAELVTKVVRFLVAEKRGAEVCRALVRIAESASGDKDRQAQLLAFLDCMSDPEILDGVVRLLDSSDGMAAAQSLLHYLPDHLGERLIPSLVGASKELTRKLLPILAQKAPAPESLARLLLEGDEQLAAAILSLAEQLGGEHLDFAIRAALVHDAPPVKVRGLRAIKTDRVPHYRTLMLDLVADPNIEIQELVLQSFVRVKDPAAVDLLIKQLETTAAPSEVLRLSVRALGSLGGDRARAKLTHVLLEHRDAELKRAAALALGLLGDPASIAVLKTESQRLFGDRAVKEACRESLRRLSKKAGSDP